MQFKVRRLKRGDAALIAALCIVLLGRGASTGESLPSRNRPTEVSQTSLPICGMRDDHRVHSPSGWSSFTPPGVGHSYVDPAFGCTVVRITESSRENVLPDGRLGSLMNYYSTFSAMNASDDMLLVTGDDGSWRIKGIGGQVVVPVEKMPPMNSGHPVWDAFEGDVFYYTRGNSLYKAIVAKSVKSELVCEFKEYRGIVSPDSADLSQDGDHIALVGQNADGSMDIFVWSLSKKSKTSVYTTKCKVNQWGVSQTPQPGCLHKLLLTPDNLLAIDFTNDGAGFEEGLRLWDDHSLSHLQDATNHIDTGYDIYGNAVFIGTNNSRTLSSLRNPCSNQWGLDIRQLHLLSAASCLMEDRPESHVSYRGSKDQPWIAESFFDSRNFGPERFDHDPSFQSPDQSNWVKYEDEIILVRVDGTAVYRLAHARSRSAVGYWSTPRAAISRDGKYIVFTSNMAYPNGCPPNMLVPNECTDVYLIRAR